MRVGRPLLLLAFLPALASSSGPSPPDAFVTIGTGKAHTYDAVSFQIDGVYVRVDNYVQTQDTIPLPEMDASTLPPSFRELLNWRGGVIEFTLREKDGRRPRAREVVSWVFDLTEEEVKGLRFIKLAET